MTHVDAGRDVLAAALPDLRRLYRDLHAHPELSGQEHRTAAVVADRLRRLGIEVTERVGGTGVVGVLANGEGPVVLLRAELDALPVAEDTGLPYASTATAVNAEGARVPVMHACGHDVHVACLLGALTLLTARRDQWRGTVLAVAQPAEETGTGAGAMVDDGLFDRFPRPDVCLAQHVGALPAGVAVTRPGPVMAASDALRVRLYGRGGHGSSPEQTVDPVVLAAAVVMRLQPLVSREFAAPRPPVLTVGAVHAGTAPNVIPDQAELLVNVRTFTGTVRQRLLAAVERVVHAEAVASAAPRAPDVERLSAFPLTVNDAAATDRVVAALAASGMSVHQLPAPLSASEDFGVLGDAAGCPSVIWHFGGTDPATWTAGELAQLREGSLPPTRPANHSPLFAPDADPTLRSGVTALAGAARSWLGSA